MTFAAVGTWSVTPVPTLLAADGRFELYKSSKYFDGKPGREQHGFPPPDKAPL